MFTETSARSWGDCISPEQIAGFKKKKKLEHVCVCFSIKPP